MDGTKGHGWDMASDMSFKKNAFGKYSICAVIDRGIGGTNHCLKGFCYNSANTDFFLLLNSGHGRDAILTQANFLI